MKIIKNDIKRIREKLIKEHLMELNKDNDTIAIELDNLTVKVFVTGKEGYINLKAEYHKGEIYDQMGLYKCYYTHYKLPNDLYFIIFCPYDTITTYRI